MRGIAAVGRQYVYVHLAGTLTKNAACMTDHLTRMFAK